MTIELIDKDTSTDMHAKLKATLEERNKTISKRFGYDLPLDVKVKLHHSIGSMKSAIFNSKDDLGVFSGYNDHEDHIHLIFPSAVETIFNDNLDTEIIVLIDYALTKFYICKKYYPESKDFKRYYGFVAESLAKISSGKLKKSMLKLQFKDFDPEERLKKDVELNLILFVLSEVEGLDKIYEHLDNIMEDKDIKKTLLNYYKKTPAEIITPYKQEAEEEHRKLLQRFKPGRRR